jgi:hypothetical protein
MTESVTIVQRNVERVILQHGAPPQMVVGENRTRVIITYQGVPGRDGSGSASTITRTAGEAIGGHRAVSVDTGGGALYANPSVADLRVPAGVSNGAAASGQAVTVQTGGVMVEGSWAWVPGPIYLAAGGLLTQSTPTSGAIVIVGHATGPTSMRIDPQLVALLN